MYLQAFPLGMSVGAMPRVEYVQVDRGGEKAHPHAVPPVSAALRLAREEAGVTQEELARRVRRAQSSVQKWEAGREPKLDRLADLENALGYRKGHVLRLAGYVEEPTSTRDAIEVDPALTPTERAHVLAAYDFAVASSSRARARSAATPPRKATRPRS